MPNYWIDDYSSGEWSLAPFIDDIVKRCEQIISKRKFVRVGFVVLDEMKLQASTSDLIEIISTLEETGKYKVELIKHHDQSDFVVKRVPKKSLKERYWMVVKIIEYLIAGLIGYAISELLQK